MANYYAANTLVRLSVAFTAAGVAADPTDVSLTVTTPAGTSTTYTLALTHVTKDGTGAYHKDITVATEGQWTFAWTGTGSVVAGTESYFYVG